MDRIELKQLALYLPYKLQMTRNGFVGELKTIKIGNNGETLVQVTSSNFWETLNYDNHYKPLLKRPTYKNISNIPLHSDDLDEIIEARDNETLTYIRNDLFTILVENHLDVFNLIEQGLAIDINTVKL